MTGDAGHAELHGGQALFAYTYSGADTFLNVIPGAVAAKAHRWKLQTLTLSGKKAADTHRAAGPSRPGMTPSRTARPSSRTNDSCTPRCFSTRVTLAAP